MKNNLFLLVFTLFANYSFAQIGVNATGSAPNTSAMLDVSSVTKGMLMPRMSSAQRIAVATPALGLLVFDSDTKTVWTYDGAIWKNLYTSGGLVLPFSQTVNTAISAFDVANQGIGAAIEGSSSAEFGTGMTAKATGGASIGLNAFSNGAGSQSIRSFADNGTAFHGENNNPANTNTLLNTLNRGIGKTGSFQLANPASTSFNVQIAGNNLGEQLKIYQTNAANAQSAVSIENSGTGTGLAATSTTGDGVVGTSNTGYGLKGITNTALGKSGVYGQNTGTAGSGVVGVSHITNTQGVYGSSLNGIAVRALGDNYRAVSATSVGGTALFGSSTTGYGLESIGKVKISGGNTNPSIGAVLTSDATGNATWQPASSIPQIAFRAAGIADAIGTTNAIVSSPFVLPIRNKIEFKSIGYNFGDDYTVYNGATTNSSSTFTVPLNGLYHFDASLNFVFAVLFDYLEIEISIMARRNGNIIEFITKGGYINSVDNTSVNISGDLTLLAGDQVFVAARQSNLSSAPSLLVDNYAQCYFNGHLIFPFGN